MRVQHQIMLIRLTKSAYQVITNALYNWNIMYIGATEKRSRCADCRMRGHTVTYDDNMPSLTLRKGESEVCEDIWGQGKCSAVILHWDNFQYFKHLLKRIEIKLIFLIQALINVKSRRVLPLDSDESLATPLSQFAPRIYLKRYTSI